MNKKLLISVFLCFFILTLGMFAQKKGEKAKTYEFLLRADAWGGPWELELLDPEDWEIQTNVTTETYHLGHVPPSRKTEVMFYEINGSFRFKWTDLIARIVRLGVDIVFSSDNIPDYEVLWRRCYVEKGETNYMCNYPIGYGEKHPFSDRYPMWRDRVDFWWVVDKGTYNRVLEEEAIPIINNFMDNGFDIGYRIWATVQGVSWVSLRYLGLEVTRLSKH